MIHRALSFWNVRIIHISDTISARASFLVEQHAMSDSMQLADALIAATALEHGPLLITGNNKHYRVIDGLELQVFRP
jgi:predicted nucleic acid-binding protein